MRRRGRRSGRLAGTQISWSMLSLTLRPMEDLSRYEARVSSPRMEASGIEDRGT